MKGAAALVYLGTAALALALLMRMAPLRTLEPPVPHPAPPRVVAATPAPVLGPVRQGRIPRGLMARPVAAPPVAIEQRPEPWTGAIFWDPLQPLAQVNGRLVGEGATVGEWSVAHISPTAVLLVASKPPEAVRLLPPWSGRGAGQVLRRSPSPGGVPGARPGAAGAGRSVPNAPTTDPRSSLSGAGN